MIFVFINDGTLDVVADVSEANRNYEGVDVENMVYHFFDDQGRFLTPHFIKPNKYGKFLWIFSWCSSGKFDLRLNPEAKKSIGSFLDETEALNPNKWFKDLTEVMEYFNSQLIDITTEI